MNINRPINLDLNLVDFINCQIETLMPNYQDVENAVKNYKGDKNKLVIMLSDIGGIINPDIEKIAKFLFDNESFLINLKQVKIAQILNITPETFSRKLAKLKKEKIIQNEKGYIKILDHSKLESYIG